MKTKLEVQVLNLIDWVSLRNKPRVDDPRFEGVYDREVAALYALIENNTERLVNRLRKIGRFDVVDYVAKFLTEKIDYDKLDRRLSRRSYPTLFPSILIKPIERELLQVISIFRKEPTPKEPRVRPVSKSKKFAETLAGFLNRVHPSSHTDVFNGDSVRKNYRHIIRIYADTYATDIKCQLLGSMSSSRQVTTWVLPNGNVTHDSGYSGRNLSLSVVPEKLRAEILQVLGINLSKSRLYRAYFHK